MILINAHGCSELLINPKIVYDRLKTRSTKLREIIDDENIPQKRRDVAFNELISDQEDLHNLNELNKIPFDVLIVIEKY